MAECMFCEGECECLGKPKRSRKLAPKKEPVAKKTEARRPDKQEQKPAPALRPAPLKSTSSVDPELEQVLRTFDYLDMLHPDEKRKYSHYLQVPKTTGRLIELESKEHLEREQLEGEHGEAEGVGKLDDNEGGGGKE